MRKWGLEPSQGPPSASFPVLWSFFSYIFVFSEPPSPQLHARFILHSHEHWRLNLWCLLLMVDECSDSVYLSGWHRKVFGRCVLNEWLLTVERLICNVKRIWKYFDCSSDLLGNKILMHNDLRSLVVLWRSHWQPIGECSCALLSHAHVFICLHIVYRKQGQTFPLCIDVISCAAN